MKVKELEVKWYMKNGRYKKERIKKDSCGESYVVGDFSWNRQAGKTECIETDMANAIALHDLAPI